MRNVSRWGGSYALLVAADFLKEFWLQHTFILAVCFFSTFNKMDPITLFI